MNSSNSVFSTQSLSRLAAWAWSKGKIPILIAAAAGIVAATFFDRQKDAGFESRATLFCKSFNPAEAFTVLQSRDFLLNTIRGTPGLLVQVSRREDDGYRPCAVPFIVDASLRKGGSSIYDLKIRKDGLEVKQPGETAWTMLPYGKLHVLHGDTLMLALKPGNSGLDSLATYRMEILNDETLLTSFQHRLSVNQVATSPERIELVFAGEDSTRSLEVMRTLVKGFIQNEIRTLTDSLDLKKSLLDQELDQIVFVDSVPFVQLGRSVQHPWTGFSALKKKEDQISSLKTLRGKLDLYEMKGAALPSDLAIDEIRILEEADSAFITYSKSPEDRRSYLYAHRKNLKALLLQREQEEERKVTVLRQMLTLELQASSSEIQARYTDMDKAQNLMFMSLYSERTRVMLARESAHAGVRILDSPYVAKQPGKPRQTIALLIAGAMAGFWLLFLIYAGIGLSRGVHRREGARVVLMTVSETSDAKEASL